MSERHARASALAKAIPKKRVGKRKVGKTTKGEKKHSVVAEVIEGAGLCIVLVLLVFWINHENVGKQFELFSYRVLQGRLNAHPTSVAVVDIGSIPPEGPDLVTSRPKLGMILTALSLQQPKVMGIDIDFSPELSDGHLQYVHGDIKYLTGEDQGFFRSCQSFGKGKVYLGISRTELLPPAEWLGDLKYQSLAAALWVPNDAREIPESLALSKLSPIQKAQARTMSFALANPDRSQAWPTRLLYHLFARTNPEPLEGVHGVEFDESYVDYSLLRKGPLPLKLPVIRIDSADLVDQNTINRIFASHRDEIYGNRVLIGDVSNATDYFDNPAEEKPVPGVLIQASAASTMADRPLYAFPGWTRYWLDLGISLLIFGTWMRVKYVYGPRTDEGRLLTIMITLAAFTVIGFALLVNVTHVLWDDFLFVALGLAIHPVSHRTWERCKHEFISMMKLYLRRST